MVGLAGLDKEIDEQMSRIPEPTEAGKPAPVEEEKQDPILPLKPQEEENPVLTVSQEEPQEQEQEKTPLLHDSQGYCFNPLLHEKNKNGTPRIWKGKLKRKKGWKNNIEEVDRVLNKEKEESFTPIEPEPLKESIKPEQEETQGQNQEEEKTIPLPGHLANMGNRQLAELFTNVFVNIGQAKFGSNWDPIKSPDGRTDRDSIVDSWEAYLEFKRAGENIPLWMRPVLEMGGYWSTRIAICQETRSGLFSFVGKTKNWLVLRYAYFKGRFSKSEAKTEA